MVEFFICNYRRDQIFYVTEQLHLLCFSYLGNSNSKFKCLTVAIIQLPRNIPQIRANTQKRMSISALEMITKNLFQSWLLNTIVVK